MTNLKITFIVFITFVITGCSTYTSIVDMVVKGPALRANWVINNLDSPESVIASSDSSFLYVSNVNGAGTDKDGDGYISIVSLDGKIIEKKWAMGLDAPKGLAILNNILYIADIDQLVLIDTKTAELISRIPVPEAKFLNDVARVDDTILVSDSATATIHQFHEGKLSVWMQDSRLNGVNGIQQSGNDVLITTMESGSLYKANKSNKRLSKVAGDMKNADGIGILKDGSYFISSWPGKLYHIDDKGVVNIVLDTEAEEQYMNDFLLLNDQLIMPNWEPGSLSSYTVN